MCILNSFYEKKKLILFIKCILFTCRGALKKYQQFDRAKNLKTKMNRFYTADLNIRKKINAKYRLNLW